MFIRFLVLFISCFYSVSSLAGAAEFTVSDEPEDKHLGVHLSLVKRDPAPQILINEATLLLVDLDNTDFKVVKNPATGLNHLSAFVAYRLSSDVLKASTLSRLYVQCPIASTTYADHSEVLTEGLIEGKVVPTSFKVNLVTLKKELLSSGYYKFLEWPEDNSSASGSNLSLQGKVTQQEGIELLCIQAEISYKRYQLAEKNRPHLLKQYGISE